MNSLLNKVTGALGALLAIAIVTRAAWELIRDALPMVLVGIVLLTIIRMLFSSRRYW